MLVQLIWIMSAAATVFIAYLLADRRKKMRALREAKRKALADRYDVEQENKVLKQQLGLSPHKQYTLYPVPEKKVDPLPSREHFRKKSKKSTLNEGGLSGSPMFMLGGIAAIGAASLLLRKRMEEEKEANDLRNRSKHELAEAYTRLKARAKNQQDLNALKARLKKKANGVESGS